jgi:hypothetical protein
MQLRPDVVHGWLFLRGQSGQVLSFTWNQRQTQLPKHNTTLKVKQWTESKQRRLLQQVMCHCQCHIELNSTSLICNSEAKALLVWLCMSLFSYKGKIATMHIIKIYWRLNVELVTLNLVSRWKEVVTFRIHLLYAMVTTSGTHWIGGCVSPMAGLNALEKRRVTWSVQQATFFTSGEQLSVNLLKLKDKTRIPSLGIFHICTLYKPSELSASTHRSLFFLQNSAQHTRIWRNI